MGPSADAVELEDGVKVAMGRRWACVGHDGGEWGGYMVEEGRYAKQ